MHLRRDFQPKSIQPDETRRVVLVVGFGRVGFHRGHHAGIVVHAFFFRLVLGLRSG